ncbi:MAG: GIY-YIG nuclease family protein [Oscillospiraceae bacterium]|jgi:putative endonuclease|nr:GIY-YIG nuclease family protein [Oscillospiraceae bacterium]
MQTGKSKKHYAYMLRCADETIYCGYTTDLSHRIKVHNSGKGAKYTRSRRPVQLVYQESFSSKREALQREASLKKLTHYEKVTLIYQMKKLTR